MTLIRLSFRYSSYRKNQILAVLHLDSYIYQVFYIDDINASWINDKFVPYLNKQRSLGFIRQ